MTKLMQQAIAKVEMLSPEDQDVYARKILEDLKDEHAWTSRFEATTDEQWDCLAAKVRRDVAGGTAVPLEEIMTRAFAGMADDLDYQREALEIVAEFEISDR